MSACGPIKIIKMRDSISSVKLELDKLLESARLEHHEDIIEMCGNLDRSLMYINIKGKTLEFTIQSPPSFWRELENNRVCKEIENSLDDIMRSINKYNSDIARIKLEKATKAREEEESAVSKNYITKRQIRQLRAKIGRSTFYNGEEGLTTKEMFNLTMFRSVKVSSIDAQDVVLYDDVYYQNIGRKLGEKDSEEAVGILCAIVRQITISSMLPPGTAVNIVNKIYASYIEAKEATKALSTFWDEYTGFSPT